MLSTPRSVRFRGQRGHGSRIAKRLLATQSGHRAQEEIPTWVNADKRGEAVNLIFGTRPEGQGAALRIALSPNGKISNSS